jgi:hypothetical protein
MDSDDGYFMVSRTEAVFHQQEAHRILAHGKICQWCKNSLILASNAVLVYRISIPRRMDRKYSAKLYFNKLNWDWVCGPECADAMRRTWAGSLIAKQGLANKILNSKPVEARPKKRFEDYRGYILRLARVDPFTTMEVVNPAISPLRLTFTT